MISFRISDSEYENDLLELVRLFDPRYKYDLRLDVEYILENDILHIKLISDKFINFSKVYDYKIEYKDEVEKKRNIKIYLKVAIYNTLSYLTEINLPYGCLTGIRPTKFFRELNEQAEDFFTNIFSVQDKKVELIRRITEIQNPLLSREDEYDIFVFIPFCPSRCKYCSFVSEPLNKTTHLVEPYISSLVRELSLLPEILKKVNGKVRAVYVGGGTPTSISTDDLAKVLSIIPHGEVEYTVEAGRPETLDEEKIELLSQMGVNRISINPQTFNDRTLKEIGRHHSSKDIEKAFKIAKDRFVINMDLISMLPNETYYDFKYSLDKAIYYQPENITIHTLYRKKGSELADELSVQDDALANKMIDYSHKAMQKAEYIPYYMYRQKYTGGSLENVGYCKERKECLYNIDIMEERTNIIAFGAAAISKKIDYSANLITRLAHVKNPYDYINRIEEIISKQREFWLK